MLKMQSPWSPVRTTKSESLGVEVSFLHIREGITAAFCLMLRVPDLCLAHSPTPQRPSAL